jgi:hypothetical protein
MKWGTKSLITDPYATLPGGQVKQEASQTLKCSFRSSNRAKRGEPARSLPTGARSPKILRPTSLQRKLRPKQPKAGTSLCLRRQITTLEIKSQWSHTTNEDTSSSSSSSRLRSLLSLGCLCLKHKMRTVIGRTLIFLTISHPSSALNGSMRALGRLAGGGSPTLLSPSRQISLKVQISLKPNDSIALFLTTSYHQGWKGSLKTFTINFKLTEATLGRQWGRRVKWTR